MSDSSSGPEEMSSRKPETMSCSPNASTEETASFRDNTTTTSAHRQTTPSGTPKTHPAHQRTTSCEVQETTSSSRPKNSPASLSKRRRRLKTKKRRRRLKDSSSTNKKTTSSSSRLSSRRTPSALHSTQDPTPPISPSLECRGALERLVEFAPVKFKIPDLENYYFYKIVLWPKSAILYKKLRKPPVVDDNPPMGIHGLFSVTVSHGSGLNIFSHRHKFKEKAASSDSSSVIKPQLLDRVNVYWPTLCKGKTTEKFLRYEAEKHNVDTDVFPDNRDFIEKGLEIGSYYIDFITQWMNGSNYRFGGDEKYVMIDFRNSLCANLNFIPDCRFYRLPHRKIAGLRKIGIMGVLDKRTRKFNPVDLQVDEKNIKKDEYFEKEETEFVLELLSSSYNARKASVTR